MIFVVRYLMEIVVVRLIKVVKEGQEIPKEIRLVRLELKPQTRLENMNPQKECYTLLQW